jgi:hypothetical protein
MSEVRCVFGVDNERLRSIFLKFYILIRGCQRVPRFDDAIEPMAAEMVQRCGPCHSMEASNNWSCLFDADRRWRLAMEANLRTDFAQLACLVGVWTFWSSRNDCVAQMINCYSCLF